MNQDQQDNNGPLEPTSSNAATEGSSQGASVSNEKPTGDAVTSQLDKESTTTPTASGPSAKKTFEDFGKVPSEDSGRILNNLDQLFANHRSPGIYDESPFQSPEWERAKAAIEKSRCIVLHSNGTLLKVAADILARRVATRVYDVESEDAGPVFTRDILERLCSEAIQDSACVIMQYPDGSANSFLQTCAKISEAVRDINYTAASRRWNTSRAMIVCVHSKGVEALIRNHSWLENIPNHEVPAIGESRDSSAVSSVRNVIDGLHAEPPKDFLDIVTRERESFIPTTLARIAVLFQDLSCSNFERLVDHVLGTRQLEVVPGNKETEAQKEDVKRLWRSAKSYFEKQAGLSRQGPPGKPQRMVFEGDDLKQRSIQWGWEDSEALFVIFSEVSQLKILFGDHIGSEDKELFRGYLAASVQLAQRAPGLFGARWLETLARDYAAWVESETELPSALSGNIFAMLGQLVKEAKLRKLWGRFAERMGQLLNQLFRDDAATVVDDFMDRLFEQGLHELAVLVALSITEARDLRLTKWMSRVMNEGGQSSRESVISQIAIEVWRGGAAVAPRLQAVIEWSNSKNSAIRQAAYSFPAVLIDLIDGKEFDHGSETSPLMRCMAVECPIHGTVGGLCQFLMSSKSFSSAAADCHQWDELDSVAITLFLHANAMPDSQLPSALQVAKSTMSWMKLREQTEVRKWWQGYADHLAAQKRAIPVSAREESKTRLADLDRRYTICKALIRH